MKTELNKAIMSMMVLYYDLPLNHGRCEQTSSGGYLYHWGFHQCFDRAARAGKIHGTKGYRFLIRIHILARRY